MEKQIKVKNIKKRELNAIGICLLALLLILSGCEPDKGLGTQNKNQTSQKQFELTDFTSAEKCKECHPNHYDEWKGSMHAYAFMDPVLDINMGKIQNEVGEEKLDQFCVQCHSPIGSLTGETAIGFNKETVDPLIKEGVTCDVCHLMVKPSETTAENAVYHYDVESSTRYGSTEDPVTNSFHTSKTVASFSQSKICLPCHNLINETGLLVESTFSEWISSPFGAMGQECQDCHMETYSGQAALNGPQRDHLHRHDFVGVDIALIDDFPDKMEQKQKVEQLMQNAATMSVNIPESINNKSSLKIEVRVKNDRTGHDLPSSVTFVRQMWLEVTVNYGTDTLYKSGYFDANGDLKDAYSTLEPNGDPDLQLFQSVLYKDGHPANVFNADSIRHGSIPSFKSRTGIYSVEIPQNIKGNIDVKVRLRFRPFPPYTLREYAQDLIKRIDIYEMAEFEGSVMISDL